MTPLLTIIVPTYNRSEELSVLLSALDFEISGLKDYVRVIIGDNNSCDGTDQVVKNFIGRNPNARSMKHSVNLGPDENFCKCLDVVESRYFWIIGDDDRPMTGSVTKIVKFLIKESPDLLYISSKWSEIIHRPSAQEFSGELAFKRLSRDSYAEKVNVWVTYISGTIINIERLYELNKNINIRRFSNSFLVQLGWVLPMLMLGNRFYFIKQECIFAKSGNSGGYELLSVFGENFPKVLKTVCGSDSRVYKIIFHSLVWNFMPTLIWANRSERATEFIKENPLPVIRGLRISMGYWFLLMPLAVFPKFSALIIWAIYRVYKKVVGLK